MTAVLKYPGAKWRIADWIISHFPEHKIYCEPFFGSGAVFFKKSHVPIETINDINGDIVNLFKVCRDQPGELAEKVRLTPYSREEFTADADFHEGDAVERARRFLIRYWQAYSLKAFGLSWKVSQDESGPVVCKDWNRIPKSIIEISKTLKNVQIENCDALELIKRYSTPETLIYCDPPYLPSTCRSNLYKDKMTEAEHIELLKILKDSAAQIIISGYDNELYDDTLAGWHTDTVATTIRLGLHRTEKIWFNFERQISFL